MGSFWVSSGCDPDFCTFELICLGAEVDFAWFLGRFNHHQASTAKDFTLVADVWRFANRVAVPDRQNPACSFDCEIYFGICGGMQLANGINNFNGDVTQITTSLDKFTIGNQLNPGRRSGCFQFGFDNGLPFPETNRFKFSAFIGHFKTGDEFLIPGGRFIAQ
jgi:hypothetical protein